MLPTIIITALLTFLVLTPLLLVVSKMSRPTPTNGCPACANGVCHTITPSCTFSGIPLEGVLSNDADYLDWVDSQPEEVAPRMEDLGEEIALLHHEDPTPQTWG